MERKCKIKYSVLGDKVIIGDGPKRRYELLSLLYERTIPKEIRLPRIIKFNSGEGRIPLTRYRTYNFILKTFKTIQLPITPNSHGIYETTDSMLAHGMFACEACGHIQAIEIRLCKNCGEFGVKA